MFIKREPRPAALCPAQEAPQSRSVNEYMAKDNARSAFDKWLGN